MATVWVAVDAGGADAGAAEVSAAAALAAADPGIAVRLFGPEAELRSGLGPGEHERIEIVDAPISIAKAPDPVAAVRAEKQASIVQAVHSVADGECAAFVSGGGTGAALAAGTLIVRRAKGVHRPALAIPLPRPGGGGAVTLLDVGANTEVRPEHLVQFAFLGAALSRLVLGLERPTVGLLSNGSEADRGRDEVREAGARLRELDGINFVGSCEGNDLLDGPDVIVTDGFTGNVVLKAAEGVSQAVLSAVKDAALSSTRTKVGGLLMKPGVSALRAEIDPEQYGGAYLLGLRALGVVPHGRFGRHGIAQAIRRAALGASSGLVDSVHADLQQAGALRGAAVAADRPSR